MPQLELPGALTAVSIPCANCGMDRAGMEFDRAVWAHPSEVVCCEPPDPIEVCPHCGSDKLECHEYEFGIEYGSGYHDAGGYYLCARCHMRCEEPDVVTRVVLRAWEPPRTFADVGRDSELPF